MTKSTHTWFPLFEFQDWMYQSFIALPTYAETDAPAGASVTGRKWGRGSLVCGQAMDNGHGGYTLEGRLVFKPGLELAVTAHGLLGADGQPGTFEGRAVGTDGPMKGAVSHLVGWVFPALPITNGAARVLCIRGAVQAVRGTDADPTHEPGGYELGGVGSFVVSWGG